MELLCILILAALRALGESSSQNDHSTAEIIEICRESTVESLESS